MQEADEAASRLRELRLLRRTPGDRGGVTRLDRRVRSRLERALGIRFRDGVLLEDSLTHRSYAFEQELTKTNERLEFLGDAVLGLIVAQLAYERFPDLEEGGLAKLRAATVNMNTLADIAREIGLGEAIFLGKGELRSGGREKTSILADALEAVIGAVYLDRGMRGARKVVERLFWPRVNAYAQGGGERDYKTALQELAATDGSLPQYRVTEAGPDHAKEFTATVVVGGRPLGSGRGRSKKDAEQQAARAAYRRLARERRTAGRP
jgi:ribonuclease-3